tara:strand:- start:2781 stop:3296 length:516 start_codon:yes stop_codon:yes gene_type:complete
MAQDNPLSDRPASDRAPVDPMYRHAQIWQHAQGMKDNDADVKIGQLEHILPVLGALAHNPRTTAKDVIKAAANSASKQVITPSEAVKFITMIPPKSDDLLPWLRDLYTGNLSLAVHLHASKMARLPAQDGSVAPQMPGPGGMMPQVSRPAPVAAPGAPAAVPGNPLAGVAL